MFPALLTTLLFALSGVAGSRMSRVLGGIEANYFRILLATALLGLWAHTMGQGFSGPAVYFFLLSGLIGFGFGDLALYQAFPLLGSRLVMLLVHCLAAPIAAGMEWIWLGTTLSGLQILSILITLAGVATALAPSENPHIPKDKLWRGILFGVIGALGQAGGAVVSRKAYAVTTAADLQIDGMTAAYQRIWGGVLIAAISYLLLRMRGAGTGRKTFRERMRGHWHWLLVNGAAGPALGVSCYQWALATTPTGIVMPVVALTPLMVVPFSRVFEGEKPTARSLVGGGIAVLGVVGLRLSLR